MEKKIQIINNLKIAFLDNEINSNTTVVFVHGNSMSSQTFNQQINNSNLNQFRLLALDLPGHGESESNPKYSISLFANILVDFCESLKLKNIILVGHSLGGHFAIQALPKLDNCLGLVLVGVSPIKIPLNIEEAYLPSKIMPLLFKKELTSTDVNVFTSNLTTENNFTLLKSNIINCDSKFREHIAASITNGDMTDEVDKLEKSTIPIALVFGENDTLVNLNYIKNLSIPGLWQEKIFIIKNAQHFPHLEKPEKFNTLLRDFIESI